MRRMLCRLRSALYGGEMTMSEAVAARVRGVMAEQRRHQAELATVLGIAGSGASRRLNGKVPFNVDELDVVARWLEVPITRLLPAQALTNGHATEREEFATVSDLRQKGWFDETPKGLRSVEVSRTHCDGVARFADYSVKTLHAAGNDDCMALSHIDA